MNLSTLRCCFCFCVCVCFVGVNKHDSCVLCAFFPMKETQIATKQPQMARKQLCSAGIVSDYITPCRLQLALVHVELLITQNRLK